MFDFDLLCLTRLSPMSYLAWSNQPICARKGCLHELKKYMASKLVANDSHPRQRTSTLLTSTNQRLSLGMLQKKHSQPSNAHPTLYVVFEYSSSPF
jgi:hypothetical protein